MSDPKTIYPVSKFDPNRPNDYSLRELITFARTEGGFYHKSIRLKTTDDLIIEFHGPLVGGYGHGTGRATENGEKDG